MWVVLVQTRPFKDCWAISLWASAFLVLKASGLASRAKR